jgi:hypothetical protein
MKYVKYWGMLSAIATFCSIFGAWAKITHKSYANDLLTFGLWTLAISQAVYMYLKFIALKNKNDQ